jgi:glycosyltransferase involved in cell wall biosynthesis
VKILVGSAANNTHLHQIGQALDESGMLSRFIVPLAGLPLRRPLFMARRQPPGISHDKIDHSPGWEIARLAAGKLRLPAPWVDRIWECQELAFDRYCAKAVVDDRPDAFLGVEHAALAALRASRVCGAAAGLIFTSLHHRFREHWMGPELRQYPELMNRSSAQIRKRDAHRDERRDEEMRAADFIHANSLVTARSLSEAGYPSDRIIAVPLGCPPALSDEELERTMPRQPIVLFVGNVALHKGAHHLLAAWEKLRTKRPSALELYGSWALPDSLMPANGSNVQLRGRVPFPIVRSAMRQASVLVLPSICDGFGMVVAESMAQGLPVICSNNAGASQLVEEGVNGFVIPPANPTVLAERLAWCLDHPGELQKMGYNAAKTARMWTWDDFRLKFVEQLRGVLARIAAIPAPTTG